MIRATKAVMQDVSEKVDFELFETLLQDIDIQNYTQEANELFVVFECIEEDQEASFELEDGVIYLTVRVPYQEMLDAENSFSFLGDCFLTSLELLEDRIDLESLISGCNERLRNFDMIRG